MAGQSRSALDIGLTADDRIAGGKSRRGGKKAKPAKGAGKGAAKPARGKAAKTSTRKKTRKGREKKPLTLGRIIGKLFYWGVVLGVWAGIIVAGIVAYYGLQLPDSDSWAVPERPANIRIIATNGKLLSNRGKMGGEAVAIHELPHYVPAAVVSIEDRRFFGHFGLDPIGILGAMRINVSEGRNPLNGHGGSTITQQVAKNLFLTPEQSIKRKIQEALIAIWLEQNYNKDQILELYLNRVYFGGGAYGIEAAAQNYFGKSASNLNLGEAAILAGVLQAPSRLSPDTHPDAAAARARVVLNAMAEEGYISQAEAEAAAIDPNKRIRTRVAGAEYYVADWVETLMQAYIGEVDEDVIVHTSINWDLQKQAEFLVREMVDQNGEERGFSQGALVAMEPDGTVKAIVGGTDYAKSQYNRAVTARRQMGSAFKPIVYLAALEAGLSPETVIDSGPLDYNGWSPENASGKYYGPVTMREGLANSLNTVAARLAIHVGPQAVVNTAYRLGISTQIDPVPSIALGTPEISLLELTAAYAPFSNGGAGVIAHVISRIETADGEVLYDHIPAGPGQVVAPDKLGMMNAMLSYALEAGTGKNAQLPGWQIAGKTGTSQEYRDAVFVGYSARMVTGIWLGNDDSTPTQRVGGGSFPAQLWTQFMAKAHEGLAPADLPGQYIPQQVQQAEQPQRQRRNIGDFLRDLFGG